MTHLITALEELRINGPIKCKKSTFKVDDIEIESWRFNDWDYQKPLPTFARGLFSANDRIVARGYDKFFNIGEVSNTTWKSIEMNTLPPYCVTVKENGCIIFISALTESKLLVCSKHSTGARDDTDISHAQMGEQWLQTHLNSVSKSSSELASELFASNLTAVAELCDDGFEEHILPYESSQAGLYIHGLNRNTAEFATLPFREVEAFAQKWGMNVVRKEEFNDFHQLKEFLAERALDGTYEGKEVEGFVIRCQRQPKAVDFFFKYKFEEPYLMYRQWRELSKAVIDGRSPKIRSHKEITRKYLTWFKKRIAEDPIIAERYKQNHGIIATRNEFLQYSQQSIDDILQDGDSAGPVILIPSGTIGCGKTALGLVLAELFGWGHVQNDNITAQKGSGKRFVAGVLDSSISHPVVFADRNNHLRSMRRNLMEEIAAVEPTARFISVHYVHYDGKNPNLMQDIMQVTSRRVFDRGDNHQSIQADSQPESEVLKIMNSFRKSFQPVIPDFVGDALFDYVVKLDPRDSITDQVCSVITQLEVEYHELVEPMPSLEAIDKAVASAMLYKPETKKRITKKIKEKKAKMKYYGIVFTMDIAAMLPDIFAQQSSDAQLLWQSIQSKNRLNAKFHVTLIHNSDAQKHPKIWEKCAQLAGVKATAAVSATAIYWDDNVMALKVSAELTSISEPLPHTNTQLHITLATLDDSVEAKQANNLFSKQEVNKFQLDSAIQLNGIIAGVAE